MNNEKFGKLLCQLRKDKKMSQQDLAEKIPIGREAISKWERGKNYPDIQTLVKLSEIFDLSINELIYGEKKNDNNIQEINNVALSLISDKIKKKKIILILIILLVLLTILFLSYYFIVNYNSILMYKIDYNDIKINISNGLILKTNDKVYFNLGTIKTEKEIEKIEIYWLNNNKKEFIMSTNNKNIFFYDYLGYGEYFDFKKINNIFNNLYIEITYKDDVQNIKLVLRKIYSNKKIFPQKVVQIY